MAIANVCYRPVDGYAVVEVPVNASYRTVAAWDGVRFACISTGEAVPPAALGDAGTATQNRSAADDAFIGIPVALNADCTVLTVATKGEFRFTQQTAATAVVGDGIEIYATEGAASNSQVVGGATDAIGYVTRVKTDGTDTTVIGRIASTVFPV